MCKIIHGFIFLRVRLIVYLFFQGMVDNTGVSFASVYSGEKAVEKGKKEYDAGREYSTIILDWKMPGMNAHIAKPINPDTLKTP